MSRINYKLEDFEGPLDLLLVLIQKNRMSIADVEIITIINQYLEVIGRSGDRDLDAASDFIDMAARLVYLKSVYLLPKDDEGERLKAELQGQLVDYSLAKTAAEKLRRAFVGDLLLCRPAMEIKADLTYNFAHPVGELVSAYAKVSAGGLRRAAPQRRDFEPIVDAPVVSVASKIYSILRGLMKNTVDSISSAFGNLRGRSEAVATFLAVLELVRARRVRIEPDGGLKLLGRERRR